MILLKYLNRSAATGYYRHFTLGIVWESWRAGFGVSVSWYCPIPAPSQLHRPIWEILFIKCQVFLCYLWDDKKRVGHCCRKPETQRCVWHLLPSVGLGFVGILIAPLPEDPLCARHWTEGFTCIVLFILCLQSSSGGGIQRWNDFPKIMGQRARALILKPSVPPLSQRQD